MQYILFNHDASVLYRAEVTLTDSFTFEVLGRNISYIKAVNILCHWFKHIDKAQKYSHLLVYQIIQTRHYISSASGFYVVANQWESQDH